MRPEIFCYNLFTDKKRRGDSFFRREFHANPFPIAASRQKNSKQNQTKLNLLKIYLST